MGLRITFDTDNAAFTEGGADEAQRIVQAVADMIGYGYTSGPLHDGNGNTVGSWDLNLPPQEDRDDEGSLTPEGRETLVGWAQEHGLADSDPDECVDPDGEW